MQHKNSSNKNMKALAVGLISGIATFLGLCLDLSDLMLAIIVAGVVFVAGNVANKFF